MSISPVVKAGRKVLAVLIAASLLISVWGPECGRAFAGGVAVCAASGRAAWVAPFSPALPAVLTGFQILYRNAYRGHDLGQGQITPQSPMDFLLRLRPDSQQDLRVFGALAARLPSDIKSRLVETFKSEMSDARKLASVSELYLDARKAAAPEVEAAMRSRVEEIAAAVARGELSGKEIAAAAGDMRAFGLYGEAVRAQIQGVEEMARASTMDRAMQIAAALIEGNSFEGAVPDMVASRQAPAERAAFERAARLGPAQAASLPGNAFKSVGTDKPRSNAAQPSSGLVEAIRAKIYSSYTAAVKAAAARPAFKIIGGGVLAAALVAGGIWAWPLLMAHYGAVAAATGWAANWIFLFFPVVQIAETLRNMRAVKKGGPEAEKASQRLDGVSTASQSILVAGNMFNYPSFLASHNPALIVNALVGAAGSLVIMGLLAWSRHFSRAKWALVTAGSVAAALVAPMILSQAAIVAALGIAAAVIFAGFAVPQLAQNNKALKIIAGSEKDSPEAQKAIEELKGIKPLYLLVGLLGNVMLVPVFMVFGRWWNVVGNILGIVGPLLVLTQLVKAGLYSKANLALLAAAVAAVFLVMVGASILVPTGFWL